MIPFHWLSRRVWVRAALAIVAVSPSGCGDSTPPDSAKSRKSPAAVSPEDKHTMTMTAEHKHTNRLIDATSPYLLQHAHNPVDWYEWGPEALERARKEDKPIFLSIGYSACHWCHVMERESFENEQIAAVMNEHFVDRKSVV